MNFLELREALRCADVSLDERGGKLIVDAPRGALTPELRSALAHHRDALLKAIPTSEAGPPQNPPVETEENFFIIDADGDEILIEDDMMASLTARLLDWLQLLAHRWECGTVLNRRGEPWHVRETVGRLIMSGGGQAWLEEAYAFYEAMRRQRPDIPHVGDAWAFFDRLQTERKGMGGGV